MTTEEFKTFWEYLKNAYPFDFKEPNGDWYKAMRDIPYKHCLNALATYRRSYKEAPTAEWIVNSAVKYKGYPDLLYKAVMARRREVEP